MWGLQGSIRLLVVLALGVLPGEATAIDFAPLPKVFMEDFQGEAASPTTPELDLLGTAGVEVDGSFTGSAALLTIDDASNISSNALFNLIDLDNVSTTGSDHGFRVEFENLSLASDGSVTLLVSGVFPAVGSGAEVWIFAGITLTASMSGDSAFLFSEEYDPSTSTPFGHTTAALSSGEAAAILSGAPVRIDTFIDDSNKSAVAELEIDGVFVQAAPLNLVMYDEQTLGGGFFVLVNDMLPPSMAEVDFTLFETFAQRLSFTPLYNVDVGGAAGKPMSGFAAAGGAGDWNSFSTLGSIPLVDVNGSASGASATIATQTLLNFGTGYQSDLPALLGDVAEDCSDPDEWSLDFSGLDDGVYRVLVYAPSGASSHTGDISIDGAPATNSLPGIFPHELLEGTSWGSAVAVVSGGTLSLDGLGNGSVSCAGITGVQLEIGTPIITEPSVPSLGAPAMLGLVSLLLLMGRLAIGRGEREV